MAVIYASVIYCNKIKPVGIIERTAGWLFINCLAVLLFVYLDEWIQTVVGCGVPWSFLDVSC